MSALISKHKLVALANSDSPRTEMYRALRTGIQFAEEGESSRVLMIASAKAGEGKSTTAGNLAVLYAQTGKKVLLVDANLRNPSIHRMFSSSNRMGLSGILSETCTAAQAVQEVPAVPGLSLLAAGPGALHPAELLGSLRMKETIEELRGLYDIVLVDSPPLLPVSDAQLLSAYCDGVVFVVRSGKVKEKEAQRAVLKLDQARARVVGVFLNAK